MSQRAWDIYLHGDLIDTVFYDKDCDKDYIYRSLVEHDGYSSDIVIVEPVFHYPSTKE